MKTVDCTDIDVMTIPGMEHNVHSSSDQTDAAKVIPRPGVQMPDYWSPSDNIPRLNVDLPEVYGVPPEEYDVMMIKIKAAHFISVKVLVYSGNQRRLFVSIFLQTDIKVFGVSKNLIWFIRPTSRPLADP